MFDNVSRKEFDAERELRIRAEASAARAYEQIADLNERTTELLSLIARERETHHQEMADLLDRVLPKPKDPVPGFGVPGAGDQHLTYEEIMSTPAVGRRGVRERNALARDAKVREEQQDKADDAGKRRAVLTPEEQQELDNQLPSGVR